MSGIPEGFRSVTPQLVIDGASKAIDFYTRAFGAQELFRMPGPDGKIMHATIRIGDSTIMLNDELDPNQKSPKGLGGSPVTIHLYVEDADAVFAQATDAGAHAVMPLADMFWGDRYGVLVDPFGHVWSVATNIEQVSDEELQKRMAAT
jgi:PhnB protein